MAAAALRLKTPIPAIKQTARRSPWATAFRPQNASPVADLWARIEREYACAPMPGAASND